MTEGMTLWWILGLALPGLALVIQPARRAHPDRGDMEPEKPLNQAAAQFIAGLAFASITLLLLVERGVIWPGVALLTLALAFFAAPRTAALKPLYRWQLAIAILGTLAVGRLWYSWIS